MRRGRTIVLSFGLVIALSVLAVLFSISQHERDAPGPQATPEQRQIAQALLRMVRSSMTNEFEIKPDDPRLPKVLRDLHPVEVWVHHNSAVVMLEPRNGLGEYHLAPVSTKNLRGPWQLLGAGPRFNNQHQELARIRGDEPLVLTLGTASELARRLANEEAQRLYGCQPFDQALAAQFVEGRWVWRDRKAHGAGDLEASVEFDAVGALPRITVLLLDSRNDR